MATDDARNRGETLGAATKGIQDWEIRQAKTFARWCNMYLARGNKDCTVAEKDPCAAFKTGQGLAALLHALYAGTNWDFGPMPVFKPAKLKVQRLDNITRCIKIYDQIGIKRVMWTREHVEEGNWTMVMGLIWSVILHANISVINTGDTTGEEALLLWCRKQCEGKKGVDGLPKNWHKNWKNGLVFNALLHRFYPNRVDYDNLNPDNCADNIEHAFKNFEELGVARLIDVEDMLVEKPDDKCVKTYVSELFKLLAPSAMAARAREHLANFMQFNRRIQGLCAEYESGAREYLEFVNQSIADFDAWTGKGTENEAQQDVNEFKNWMDKAHVNDKKRIDLEMLNANIRKQQMANGRTPWECPEDIAPEALDATAIKLDNADRAYFNKIREHRFSFIKAGGGDTDEQVVAEAEKAFRYFDKENTGYLDAEKFFACMAAVGVSIPDYEKSSKFATVADAEGKVSLEAYINHITTFFTQKDTPEGLLESGKLLGDPTNLDGAEAGFTGDDLEAYNSQVPDKNLDKYIRENFSKDSSSY